MFSSITFLHLSQRVSLISKICFQHLSHFSFEAAKILILFSLISFTSYSTLEVMSKLAKSTPTRNSAVSLLISKLTSADKLPPITP